LTKDILTKINMELVKENRKKEKKMIYNLQRKKVPIMKRWKLQNMKGLTRRVQTKKDILFTMETKGR